MQREIFNSRMDMFCWIENKSFRIVQMGYWKWNYMLNHCKKCNFSLKVNGKQWNLYSCSKDTILLFETNRLIKSIIFTLFFVNGLHILISNCENMSFSRYINTNFCSSPCICHLIYIYIGKMYSRANSKCALRTF